MIIKLIWKLINYTETVLRKLVILYKTSSFKTQLNKIHSDIHKDKIIVFIDTDCIVGGSQKITIKLGESLKKLNYKTIYIATESYGSAKDWKNKIIKSFTDFIDLRMMYNRESKLIKSLKIIKPDYVIIINSKFGYNIAPIIKNNIPNIIIYDIIHASINISNRFISKDTSAESIDLRITACDGLKENLINNYSKKSKNKFKERILTIMNGTEIDPLKNKSIKTSFREDLNIQNSDFVVLYIGTFAEHKDPMSILKISEIISKDYDDIHFVLFGNGPLKHKLEYHINKKEISNNTHMIVNSNNIYGILSESDILILPSIVESLGLVILEAMSMGIPPLVSDVGHQNEIIDDQIDGFLIKRDSKFIDNYIDKIIYLKNNKEIYSKIKNSALKKVKSKFDINKSLNHYHNFFK